MSSSIVCEIDDFDLTGFAAIAAGFGLYRYGYVVTPNVDHLLRYYEDPSFRALYSSATYVLLDSRVIALALRALKGKCFAVCPGSDLMVTLLSRVTSATDRIVLIGGRAALSRRGVPAAGDARAAFASSRHNARPSPVRRRRFELHHRCRTPGTSMDAAHGTRVVI